MDTAPRSGCAINAAVEVLGDPWAMLVLRDIMFGNRRHFRQLIVGSEERIATNILASRLKQLVAAYAHSGYEIAPVLAKLHGEINRLLASPDMRDKVRSVGGLEPFISTPEEFAALIRAEYAKYGEVVKAVGVKID